MNGVTIQINSLEALERLIGGDSELEVGLRGGIVQEFAKRHLKGIADERLISEGRRAIINYIDENYIKLIRYNPTTYGSKPALKTLIEEDVKSSVSTEINRAIREYMEKDETLILIKQRLDDKVIAVAARIEEELADAILTKRIDDLVNKKLKERLGL